MTKKQPVDRLSQPYFDEAGGLVIPSSVISGSRSEGGLRIESINGTVRVRLASGEIVSELDGGSPIDLPEEDSCTDLLKLAEGSMSFWDNPVDDAVWNNA